MSADTRKAELVLTSQESLAKQIIAKNGIPRDVHVVVKNTPFSIHLAFTNPTGRPNLDRVEFSRCTVNIEVHYDNEDPSALTGKKVSLLNSKPCEYLVHVSEKKKDEAVLEVRMKVLTSQHEDMLFRLHIQVTDEIRKQTYQVISAAIKVVSKPEQVRRINGEKTHKRIHSDVVGDALERIEQCQQQQQQILMKLLKSSNQKETKAKEPKELPKEPRLEDVSFEEAFSVCLKKFASIPHEERPTKIRKMITSSSARDSFHMTEFVDVMTVAGLGKPFSRETKPQPEPVPELDSKHSEFAELPLPLPLPCSAPLSLSLTTSEGFYHEMMQYALDPEFLS